MAKSARRSTLCIEVVKSIADREGIDLRDVTPPLSDVIDPDALESLFEGKDGDGLVQFDYHGYAVSIDSEKTVEIETTT